MSMNIVNNGGNSVQQHSRKTPHDPKILGNDDFVVSYVIQRKNEFDCKSSTTKLRQLGQQRQIRTPIIMKTRRKRKHDTINGYAQVEDFSTLPEHQMYKRLESIFQMLINVDKQRKLKIVEDKAGANVMEEPSEHNTFRIGRSKCCIILEMMEQEVLASAKKLARRLNLPARVVLGVWYSKDIINSKQPQSYR